METVDIIQNSSLDDVTSAKLISLECEVGQDRYSAKAPQLGNSTNGMALIRDIMDQLWKNETCRKKLKKESGNTLYRCQKQKPGAGWERRQKENDGGYWLYKSLSYKCKVPRLKDTLVICGVTSAVLKYEPKKQGGDGDGGATSSPKASASKVRPARLMLWAPPFKIEEATNNNGKSPSTFLETKDKGTLLSNSDTGAVVYFVNCEGTNCEIVAHGIVGTEKIEYLYCTENNMRVEDELKGLHIKQIWEPSTQKVIPINDDNVREKLWKAWTKKVADKLGFNRIIFGAPGTGKSYQLNKQAEYCFDADHMERVTFHPEYSYFDFVGSYKPVMEGKNIKYDFIPGPFARILVKALNDKEHPYLLLIEEINRARVAAVFGDIFQLLDRNESGESEYEIMPSLELARYLQNNPKLKNEEIKPIRIPNNLYIWATMNSADQGVYPLDTAFKRRWSMEYIPYNPPKGKILPDDKWNQIRTGINRLLLEKGHVNEDKLMGYYFLKKEERTSDKLKDALQNKVLMYLFDDAAKHCRKEIFKIEGKDVITFSALQNKMRAAMEQPIDPNSNLGVFSEELHQPDAGQ